MDDGQPVLRIIIFIILLLLDALISGFKVAASALSESELARQAEEGNKKSAGILAFVREPSYLLSTVEVIATGVALVAGAFVARPFFRELTELLQTAAGLTYLPAALLSHLIIGLLMIYLIIVLGILFPKRLAYKYAAGWAGRTLWAARLLTLLARPLVWLINHTVLGLVHLAGIDPKDIEENVTEEEIIMMVSEGHEQGVIEASEAEMISNILEFDDTVVGDIMTHRRNICSIDADMKLMDAAALMAQERYSRYPVYKDDEDNIIGILHLKDVMRRIMKNDREAPIESVMRKPYFVPDTQSINKLFRIMQASKVHMAVVVDEYGQNCGLVAMEDILEEIVGNILDEYDTDEQYIQKIGDAYLMKGMTPLEDLESALGISIDEDLETLNGLLISRLERIPRSNEGATVEIEGYSFRVIGIRDNTISLVKVTKNTA